MHDKERTKQILEKCGTEEVEAAVTSLLEKKLISRSDHQNRTIPGRQYRMTEKYFPRPFLSLFPFYQL